MLVEAIAAVILGGLALFLVVEPLIRRGGGPGASLAEAIDPEETPKGIALAALKEIEFDKATGKLSDADYQQLMTKYTGEAVEAMRAEEVQVAAAAPTPQDSTVESIDSVIAAKVRALRAGDQAGVPACPTCGPRPESDAVFCSSCGSRLSTGHACAGCGAALPPDGRFCESCGRKVAA
jgi:rRNA maturation endonuclease Nob1